MYRLWQPDAFHLLHLGILKVMMDWLVGYLRQRKILGRFNDCLKSTPPYPGIQPFKPGHQEVSSWQGKEIRTMMGFFLAVLGPILIDEVRSSQSEDARVVACIRSIVEFLLVLGQATTLITHSVCWITDSQYSTRASPFFVRKGTPKQGPRTLRQSGPRWRRRVAKRDGQGHR